MKKKVKKECLETAESELLFSGSVTVSIVGRRFLDVNECLKATNTHRVKQDAFQLDKTRCKVSR